MEVQRVVIIGGGISGAALALFLKKAGIPCRIFEAHSPGTAIGGGLQIAPNGMKVLAALGLADELIQRGAVTSGIRFRNQSGELLSVLEHQRPEKHGQVAVNAARRTVHEILVAEMRKQGVEAYFERRLGGVDRFDSQPGCTFEDGTRVEADVVVGADGLHSRVRACLFPHGPEPGYTGLIAAGGFANPAILTLATLPPPKRVEMIFGRRGFFGYGYADHKNLPSSIMWWSAIPGPEIPRENIAAYSNDDIRGVLLDAHRGWCAPVEALIRESHNSIYLGNIYDIHGLPAWSKGRVAIIGDAAHAVSPHSGQGASMALEDAAELAALLRAHLPDAAKAFSAFERQRRARTERVVEFGRHSGNQKRELGRLGAWLRDRYVAWFLPRAVLSSSEWMYSYELKWP